MSDIKAYMYMPIYLQNASANFPLAHCLFCVPHFKPTHISPAAIRKKH